MRIVERTRGAWINFAGMTFDIKSKVVARRMLKIGTPVWSAKPRPSGFSVVTLSCKMSNLKEVQIAGIDSGVHGLDLDQCVKQLAQHYIHRLEAACRAK